MIRMVCHQLFRPRYQLWTIAILWVIIVCTFYQCMLVHRTLHVVNLAPDTAPDSYYEGQKQSNYSIRVTKDDGKSVAPEEKEGLSIIPGTAPNNTADDAIQIQGNNVTGVDVLQDQQVQGENGTASQLLTESKNGAERENSSLEQEKEVAQEVNDELERQKKRVKEKQEQIEREIKSIETEEEVREKEIEKERERPEEEGEREIVKKSEIEKEMERDDDSDVQEEMEQDEESDIQEEMKRDEENEIKDLYEKKETKDQNEENEVNDQDEEKEVNDQNEEKETKDQNEEKEVNDQDEEKEVNDQETKKDILRDEESWIDVERGIEKYYKRKEKEKREEIEKELKKHRELEEQKEREREKEKKDNVRNQNTEQIFMEARIGDVEAKQEEKADSDISNIVVSLDGSLTEVVGQTDPQLGEPSVTPIEKPEEEDVSWEIKERARETQKEMIELVDNYAEYVRKVRRNSKICNALSQHPPHDITCHPHEYGLVRTNRTGNRRGYCFGSADLEGDRVCDSHVPNHRVLMNEQSIGNLSYGVRELLESKFAYIPYYHKGAIVNVDMSHKMAVTTQGTWNRKEHLIHLTNIWQGPVSFALLLDNFEQLSDLDHLIAENPVLQDYVDVHVVWRLDHSKDSPGAFYPINMLRNIALETVNADWVFVLDIDVTPNAPMKTFVEWTEHADTSLRQLLKERNQVLICPGLLAYVPPAVEMHAEVLASLYKDPESSNGTIPKSVVGRALWRGDAKPMHSYFGAAYLPTNHFEWIESEEFTPVFYLTRFEPYYISRMPIPLFNETFINRGGNYAEQVYEMSAGGFHFFRLPRAFVVDIPHSKKTKVQNKATNNTSLLENQTEQAVQDEDLIEQRWWEQYLHVRERYRVNMPTPSIDQRHFRKYRRGLETAYSKLYRILRAAHETEQQ